MIHPNDLRIGNYVSVDNKNIFIVKGLLNDMVVSIDDGTRFYSKYFGYKEIKGIPLTEEILLKFDFVMLDEGQFVYVIDNYSEITVWLNYNKCIELSTISGIKYREINTVYIHKLQNIYYSLTGKELTFIN